MTHSLYSKRLAENNPDSDHFDDDGAVTERVAKRRQPGIDLEISKTVCELVTVQNASLSYIAEHSCEVSVGGGYDKCDDIQVEDNGSQYNDIVEVWTGQTNQPVVGITLHILSCMK